jgi:SpoVK/Ycf46/Vps4 family AAA+-type ATPase
VTRHSQRPSAHPIDVVLAITSSDLTGTEVIAENVDARDDMRRVEHRCIPVSEVERVLDALPPGLPCAVILLGRSSDTNEMALRWLAARTSLVVMQLDLVERRLIQLELRDPGLDSMLNGLHGLVSAVGEGARDRFARIQLAGSGMSTRPRHLGPRPLLQACARWIDKVLREAEDAEPHIGPPGADAFPMRWLDSLAERMRNRMGGLADADAALDLALATADSTVDPLAIAKKTFELSTFEFRLLLLALSPELDVRFQRRIGFWHDELVRRVGTMPLFHLLLGASRDQQRSGNLARWLAFDGLPGRPAAADEPLKLDPFLAQWLLGVEGALAADPVTRRALRTTEWPGATLLERPVDRELAALLIERLEPDDHRLLVDELVRPRKPQWIILAEGEASAWRALLEIGAAARQTAPIRVEPTRLASLDLTAVEECAIRVARLARLTRDPLVVDIEDASDTESEEPLRLFLATLGRLHCRCAVICRDEARAVRLLGGAPYDMVRAIPLSAAGRVAAVQSAASKAHVYLTDEMAASIATRFPLQVDGLEQAMSLARSRTEDRRSAASPLESFSAACKDVAASHVSHLVDRIEPIFDLDSVVLPADRHSQLVEIVDNVRLAPQVLDGWGFGEQLQYGRGVMSLFFGPSGTGKTMAAIGIAGRLGVQLLRLDLSRVVSKYIGDTEKHIDRVFVDAHRSGAAILIDEADALLGKRSEVKDAHDRYANIEVAYLLQRMEAHDGLAMLTTNMRQSVDPAFLRRFRFIIDFPRPDQAAREKIWRQCLPAKAHRLDDAAFRQLARRIDLTGGHIRQITLRAAFIAAAANTDIRLEHVAQAARAELAKLGLPPVELDLSPSRKAA